MKAERFENIIIKWASDKLKRLPKSKSNSFFEADEMKMATTDRRRLPNWITDSAKEMKK